MPEFLGAVLWDLDGTLVDSEEYHWRAWKETLDREGISITRQDFLSSFGCIVVEDAQAGVEAARRAEMRSIGVGPNANSLGADIAAAKLSDLPCDVFSSLLRI